MKKEMNVVIKKKQNSFGNGQQEKTEKHRPSAPQGRKNKSAKNDSQAAFGR